MFRSTKQMYEADPYIDKVHHFDFLNASKRDSLQFVRNLRKERFDLSINIYPQNRREYNLIAFLIGAKKRLAVRYRRRDPQNLSWLNTHTILEDDTLHCVEEKNRAAAFAPWTRLGTQRSRASIAPTFALLPKMSTGPSTG